jgi:hypothetical protein
MNCNLALDWWDKFVSIFEQEESFEYYIRNYQDNLGEIQKIKYGNLERPQTKMFWKYVEISSLYNMVHEWCFIWHTESINEHKLHHGVVK